MFNTIKNQKYSIVYSSLIRIPKKYLAFQFWNEAGPFKEVEYLLQLRIKNIL